MVNGYQTTMMKTSTLLHYYESSPFWRVQNGRRSRRWMHTQQFDARKDKNNIKDVNKLAFSRLMTL